MENQYQNKKGPRLSGASFTYIFEDHDEIRRLGLQGETYDGSPIDCVVIRQNLSDLEVHLINQDRITKYAHNRVPNMKEVETSAWVVQRPENKVKVIKHCIKSDFIIGL
jgi:hypothetical protein